MFDLVHHLDDDVLLYGCSEFVGGVELTEFFDEIFVDLVLAAILRLDEGVVECLLCGDSLLRVLLEHFKEEIVGSLGDGVFPDFEGALFDFFVDLVFGVAFERGVSVEEDVEDDSATPDIALFVVEVVDEYFWCDVVGLRTLKGLGLPCRCAW